MGAEVVRASGERGSAVDLEAGAEGGQEYPPHGVSAVLSFSFADLMGSPLREQGFFAAG